MATTFRRSFPLAGVQKVTRGDNLKGASFDSPGMRSGFFFLAKRSPTPNISADQFDSERGFGQKAPLSDA